MSLEPSGCSCGEGCALHDAAVCQPGKCCRACGHSGTTAFTLPRVFQPRALQPSASVVQLPWYLQKDSNGRDVATLLKLLAVKDKMIDALLREKTQPSTSPQAPLATLHAASQTPPPPPTTSSFVQCDPPSSSPNATDVLSLLHSVPSPTALSLQSRVHASRSNDVFCRCRRSVSLKCNLMRLRCPACGQAVAAAAAAAAVAAAAAAAARASVTGLTYMLCQARAATVRSVLLPLKQRQRLQ
jgi:hypothetical protein